MPRDDEAAWLRLGYGGWVRYRTSSSAVVAYVRYADDDGRLVATEVYLENGDDAPLDSNTLRDVRLGEIDAWVNVNATTVRERLTIPGPDLRRAARHFTTSFGTRTNRETGEQELNRAHWVADMLFAQRSSLDVPQAPLPKLEPLAPIEIEPVDATLDVPTARPYGEDFYRAVAERYEGLALTSRSPAGDIADANGVPVTTAHRWVKIARQKGFLEPGRQGKRG